MDTSTVTSKGQITIPAKFRKQLNIKPSDKVSFSISNKKLFIEKVPDFFDLRGSLKTNKKPVSSSKMREMFMEHMAFEAVGKKR